MLEPLSGKCVFCSLPQVLLRYSDSHWLDKVCLMVNFGSDSDSRGLDHFYLEFFLIKLFSCL